MAILKKSATFKIVFCLLWSGVAYAEDFCFGMLHNGGDGYSYYRLHCDGSESEAIMNKEEMLRNSQNDGLVLINSFFDEKVFVFSPDNVLANSSSKMCLTARWKIDTAGKLWVALGLRSSDYTTHLITDCGDGIERRFKSPDSYAKFLENYDNYKSIALTGPMIRQNSLFHDKLASENEELELSY